LRGFDGRDKHHRTGRPGFPQTLPRGGSSGNGFGFCVPGGGMLFRGPLGDNKAGAVSLRKNKRGIFSKKAQRTRGGGQLGKGFHFLRRRRKGSGPWGDRLLGRVAPRKKKKRFALKSWAGGGGETPDTLGGDPGGALGKRGRSPAGKKNSGALFQPFSVGAGGKKKQNTAKKRSRGGFRIGKPQGRRTPEISLVAGFSGILPRGWFGLGIRSSFPGGRHPGKTGFRPAHRSGEIVRLKRVFAGEGGGPPGISGKGPSGRLI